MNIRQRRAFYSIFIILFLIVAPLLVLYTTGYRYNFQKHKIEQIGVLFLDTIPTNASLWLNNELLSTTRPLRLTNLRPNYYTVKAEKDGYFIWQKDLEVKSRESTLAYDIVLFKNNTPTMLEKNNIQTYDLSTKGDILTFTKNNEVWIIDLTTDTKTKLTTLPATPLQPILKLSTDKKFLLIDDEQKTFDPLVLEINHPENSYSLKKILPANFSSLLWNSNNKLLGLSQKSLYEIDFLNQVAKKITDDVDSFTVTDGDIYLSKNDAKNTIIFHYNRLNLFQPIKEVVILPLDIYTIGEYKNNFLYLSDSKNEIYLVDLSDNQQPLLRLNGTTASWGQGSKNNFLYYYNKSELWIFDPKNIKSSLLNRYDEEIKNVIPLYNAPYYLLQLNDRLTISELDDRDKRQSFALFEGKEVKKITIDKDGKNIYFIDKLKDGNGLFKIEIQ